MNVIGLALVEETGGTELQVSSGDCLPSCVRASAQGTQEGSQSIRYDHKKTFLCMEHLDSEQQTPSSLNRGQPSPLTVTDSFPLPLGHLDLHASHLNLALPVGGERAPLGLLCCVSPGYWPWGRAGVIRMQEAGWAQSCCASNVLRVMLLVHRAHAG